ncbi:DUF202 domain-containing protein [Nocardia sp. GCM10030253]|uniref:DUF202 domain-containing protein n=1 Tax=Nocardia sp. GCM10030253 TaxID=3273404 RepID=UPI00363E790C
MSPATLAAERTALAWRRTAIAAMVVAALFLNHAATSGWRAAAIAPIAAAITLAVLAGICYSRNRSLHEGRFGHGKRVVAATVVAVVAVACVAAAIGMADPRP